MKKIFKTILIGGATILAAHFGLKAYKRISGIAKLAKSLPEFMNNVYGEAPILKINRSFNTIFIRAGFTQDTLDKHSDIESTIREYVDDFYPDLSKCSVDIDIYVPGEEEDFEAEEEEETEAEEEIDE